MSDPGKRFVGLIKRLRGEFGAPPPPAAAEPGPPAEADPIVDQMLFSFLLWETTTTHATAAQKRLREAFVDLNELRVCFPEEISAAIGERIPKSRERATRLRAALNDIYRREHGLSLQRLADLPKREARTYMESLEGMPSFVAARVSLVALGGHAIPVDERLLALLVQERALEADMGTEEACSWLERQVRANEVVETYFLLRSWADEEGGSSKRERKGAKAADSHAAGGSEGAEGRRPAARRRSTKPKSSK